MKKLFIYWHEDSFLSRNGTIFVYDKLEHVILAFIGMVITSFFIMEKNIRIFLLLWAAWNVIGVLWEIFQLVIQNQPIQIKDIAANNIGFLLSFFLYI